MFNRRYFGARYWSSRYWPKGSSVAPVTVHSGGREIASSAWREILPARHERVAPQQCISVSVTHSLAPVLSLRPALSARTASARSSRWSHPRLSLAAQPICPLAEHREAHASALVIASAVPCTASFLCSEPEAGRTNVLEEWLNEEVDDEALLARLTGLQDDRMLATTTGR